nr:MAG TPA: hypothetical protein [Caudoviricetes sp.]
MCYVCIFPDVVCIFPDNAYIPRLNGNIPHERRGQDES